MYKPNPFNTDDIRLSAELEELGEKLAENVHENWAAARISEGWTYGTQRDDFNKTTPCLVPYDKLPEAEKEYDRITALQTLKLVIALGYKIEKEN